MQEFPGIPFIVDGKEEDFRPTTKRPNTTRGDEYWYYMRVANILAFQIWSNAVDFITFGNVDANYLERHSLGTSNNLIREQEKEDGFPDFAIVKESLIISFDHFKIDPSSRIGPDKKPKGTEYLRLLNTRKKNELPIDTASMTEAITSEEISLTTSNLAKNLINKFTEKATTLDGYALAIQNHIKSRINKMLAEKDLAKPIETWLMIEKYLQRRDFSILPKQSQHS